MHALINVLYVLICIGFVGDSIGQFNCRVVRFTYIFLLHIYPIFLSLCLFSTFTFSEIGSIISFMCTV